MIFSAEDHDFYNAAIDPVFYQEAKQYFLKNPEYVQEIALIAEIRLEQIIDQEALARFITSLSLERIQGFLQHSF